MNAAKAWALNKLLSGLFNTFTVDQVLTIRSVKQPNGKRISSVSVGGETLPENESNLLGSEARSIRQMGAWKRLIADVKSKATDDLVNRSKHVDDMVFAKAMLYTLDMLEKKLEQLSDV